MFEILISGIEESENLRNTWATKAIGLVDPEEKIKSTDTYFVQKFHDVSYDAFNFRKPEIDQVIACLYFSKSFEENDKILVHCHAGVSRSTAIAIAVLLYHGLNIDEAYAVIENVRPILWPNSLIIQYTDELLELDGALINYDDQWKNKRRSTLVGIGTKQSNVDEMNKILEKMQLRLGKTL